MPNRWFMWLIGVWIVFSLVGGVIEKVEYGGHDMMMIQAMFNFFTDWTNLLNPAAWHQFLGYMRTIFLFDYVFLTSTWWGNIIRFIFLGISLVIMIAWILNIIGMFRGTSPTSD